jgi:hypothetical protein
MGGLLGKKPDTSAAQESIRLQREQLADQKKEAETEKRKYGEQQAAAMAARRRGGKRGLLASSRFSPELGVDDENLQSTLGA